MLEPEESDVNIGGRNLLRESKQRHTRTRRGCERCREKRRKCDEGKPKCRRCLDAGAGPSCKYVLHLSFKDKNSQTLANHGDQSPATSSRSLVKYPTIEFLVEEGARRTGPRKCSSNSSNSLAEGWPLVGRSPLSNTEVELLKYYGHHVASWLDVYDQGKTYAHYVTELAMDSPCVLEVLLQVAAVFSGQPAEIVTRRGAGIFHLQAMSNPPGADSPSSALRMIACFVLARTLLFVDTIPDSWESNFHGNGAFIYFEKFEFLDTNQRHLWLAFLTLILRLELAYYLMKQEASVWLPELAHHIRTRFGTNYTVGNESRELLYASIQCLALLVDTMSFSFPAPLIGHEGSTTATSRVSHVNRWKELMDRLHAWHENRPSQLKPLIEIENTGDTFPAVIFTSGSGISSNMLYHTALLLLLSNKPQSAPFDEEDRELAVDTAQTSPHWHAHRICCIAVHSEPEYNNCWDPVMIAAFSLAARRMTHRSQQQEILDCINRLKVIGWRIDSLIDRLHSEWGVS